MGFVLQFVKSPDNLQDAIFSVRIAGLFWPLCRAEFPFLRAVCRLDSAHDFPGPCMVGAAAGGGFGRMGVAGTAAAAPAAGGIGAAGHPAADAATDEPNDE